MRAFVVFSILFCGINGKALDEDFGYVEVRPGAHMFWAAYHTELPGDWSSHPLILWLQGGPGASGVGFGNFMELGPYDIDGNLRPFRWTKKANLLFVDNPVGSGYSYADNSSVFCTDNDQIANDLLKLLKSVFSDHPEMQKMPFFVYAESYGGKMTVDFALKLHQAISNEEISCNFQGVALGDSWIHPMNYVNTWAPYLYWLGLVNRDGQKTIEKFALKTQSAVDRGNWRLATKWWSATETVVEKETFGVDFYNVLSTKEDAYAHLSTTAVNISRPHLQQLYKRHVLAKMGLRANDLDSFMNGPQKRRWNIPEHVVWGGQSNAVFEALSEDFMKPVVQSVSKLLSSTNIHVAIFNGDLDLICDTPGTYQWVQDMEYPQKKAFEKTSREALHVTSYGANAGYVRRYKQISLFTILNAGHMVPIDAPEMALNMVDMITEFGSQTFIENGSEGPLRIAKERFSQRINEVGQNSDPVKSDPIKRAPSKSDPVKSDPSKSDPSKSAPVQSDPSNSDPSKSYPTKSDPSNGSKDSEISVAWFRKAITDILKAFKGVKDSPKWRS